MTYIMKGGALFLQDRMLMKIRNILVGSERKIEAADGTLLFQTQLCRQDPPANTGGDVRYHRYLLTDLHGNELAWARPGYAPGQDPEKAGWPVCRTPRVDHAILHIADNTYRLVMANSREYLIEDRTGKTTVRILHRGLTGGWNIDADKQFSPGLLCAVFIFCRYMEQENELVIV